MTQDRAFASPPDPGGSWPLWIRQTISIVRLEWFRYFLGRRSIPVWILASMPVMLMGIRLIAPIDIGGREEIPSAVLSFAQIHNAFVIRALVFLGCILIFTNLFRGEMVHQTLHYYLLAPVRRSVLVAGKFTAGLVATSLIFGGSVGLSYLLLLAAHGGEAARAYLTSGPAIGHLIGFVGVTVLACLGYGTVFLLIGIVFRNPMIAGVLIWGWEWLNFLLPAALKKISIIHYVQSLAPVPIDEGPLAVVAAPTSAWVAIPGLLVLAAILLWTSGRILHGSEIRYGTD